MTERKATIARTTSETDIKIALNLDGSGNGSARTGIPFLDHMLTLFAKHGIFDLDVSCKGDLEIDAHHSVEDVGICLGKALVQAMIDDGPGAGFRWMLHTADAHELYRRFGFREPDVTYLERPGAHAPISEAPGTA